MISLKKEIESQTVVLLDATMRAYLSALSSAGTSAERAVPGVDAHLSASLAKLQQQLRTDPMPATVRSTEQAVSTEFSQWADSVDRHLRAKAVEAREIMLVMANAAQSLGNRDKRYLNRFRELTSRFEEIANLEDLSEVRRSLMVSVSELSADLGNMETEGRSTIASLETRLEGYRKELAEAERRGSVDVLTGLMNRRGIELSMTTRLEAKVPFCVVVLDLNSFKPVNDNYGHLAGDDLLKQFSAELRAQFRPADLIGRWGGDEFIIVMNGGPGDAQNSVDRVRKWAFGTYKVQTSRGTCPVELSASIGLAEWDRSETMEQLLGRADQSMYQEKRDHTHRA